MKPLLSGPFPGREIYKQYKWLSKVCEIYKPNGEFLGIRICGNFDIIKAAASQRIPVEAENCRRWMPFQNSFTCC